MGEKKLIHISNLDKLVLEDFKKEAEILGITLTDYLLFKIFRECENGIVINGELTD